MFNIRKAASTDIGAAVAVLGDAFARDPLMMHVFQDNPGGVRAGVMRFFSILLRVRIALDMPAFVLEEGGEVRGAAMGYDTSRPAWPAALTAEMHALETDVPGFAARMADYEKICDAHQPGAAHYYLGVIGVQPSLQGKGAGKALLEAFCAPSGADATSHGVYLDTSNTKSLDFYYRNGFELMGEGVLGDVRIWCVFRRT